TAPKWYIQEVCAKNACGASHSNTKSISESGLASPRAYEPTSATPAMVGWWATQSVTRSKKSETTCAVPMEESRITMPKAVYERHQDYPCPQGSRFRR